MKGPIATLAIAGVLTLSLNACGSHAPTRVPRIVGLTLRTAEQRLFSHHLGWRVAPGTQAYRQSLPPNEHTSMDDIPVTGQQPAAGTPSGPGAVVTIITRCTATHPCS